MPALPWWGLTVLMLGAAVLAWAGLRPAKRVRPVREPVRSPDAAEVVPIGQGRRFAG